MSPLLRNLPQTFLATPSLMLCKATNNLLGTLSHELPDNVFEKGDVRPVKQTRKKIIKKKAVAATNGVTVGRKRAADEVCIPVRISSISFVFPQPRGGERYGGLKKKTGSCGDQMLGWRKWSMWKIWPYGLKASRPPSKNSRG